MENSNETAKTMTIGGVTHPIEDTTARQGVASLQSALDAIIGGDTTTAIRTFQEVINFLAGVTDDETLIGKLNALNTLISGKVDKETGKGLSTNDYTTADKQKLAGLSNYDDTNVYDEIDDVRDAMPKGDFKVSVTVTESRPGAQEISIDKTYAQIVQAIADGYRVYAVMNGTSVLDLVAIGESSVLFSSITDEKFSVITISASGVILNDYSTINNISYNALTRAISVNRGGFVANLFTLAAVAISGSYNDLTDKPTIPSALSGFSEDSTHRTVTDAEKATWNGKQAAMTPDSTPTANSTNYVTSGGIKTYVDSKTSMPIVSLTPTNNTAALDAGKYYLLGSVGSSTAANNVLTLSFTTSQTEALSYMGRFTAVADALSLSLPSGIHFTDNVPDIEAGHTYEFNILYDTCVLTDITYTA